MSAIKYNRKVSVLVYVAFAVFYFWMAAQIPYTHDDWDWGIDIGLQQFLHATVNSRYMGNFFEIIMTRSEFLKIIIMGSTCFLIPYMLSSLAAKTLESDTVSSRTFLFVVCNFFLLTMNQILWRQTYGWVAGFSNFSISAIFLMFWIREILNAADGFVLHEKESLLDAFFCFMISICGQLFLENIAIYCFFVSSVLVAVYLVKYKKVPIRISAMLAGSLIGLIIMFSSSIYSTLFQDGTAINNYRNIPIISGSGIFNILYTTLRTLIFLTIRLYSLNFILSIGILLLFILYLTNSRHTKKCKYDKAFLIINISLIFSFLLCWIYDSICTQHSKLIHCFDFFVSAVYFLTVLMQTIHLFGGKTRKMLLSLWISAPLIIFPLVATTEIGHRLFFTSNIFLILFSLILFVSLINIMPKKEYTVIKRIFACLSVVLLCFYINIYVHIGEVNQARMNIIEDALQKGEETIILPAFPYDEYLHNPNPTGSSRSEYYKAFYGIPANVNLIFEP